MKIFIVLMVLSLNLFAQDEALIKQFPGKWKLEIENAKIYEEWSIVEDTELVGSSYYFENDKRKILENLYIKKFADQWAYVALPEGQIITLFALKEHTSDKFTFENREHDFPQKIIYHFLSKDKIEVKLEGVKEGKEKSMELTFYRAD